MPNEKEEAKQPAASPLSVAADRIRESAKWLIASFAAVGALLIAGLQIADIGDLEDSRLRWAVVGIAIGVLGVVVAIAAASSVVTKSFVTLKGLAGQDEGKEPRKSIDGDSVLLGGATTVSELHDTFVAASQARLEALKAYYEEPSAENRGRAERSSNWAQALGRITSNVLDRASFLTLVRSYKRARWGILTGAALTAFGIATFAWAANPPEPTPPAPVVAKTPTEVTVVIKQPNQELASTLGESCDLSAVKAVAVADVGASYQVTSIPTADCKPALFLVTPRIGRVVLGGGGDTAPTTQSEPQSGGG